VAINFVRRLAARNGSYRLCRPRGAIADTCAAPLAAGASGLLAAFSHILS